MGYITVVASALYVLSEWLFFITKASFMDSFGGAGKFGSLILPILALVLPSLILGALLAIVGRKIPTRYHFPWGLLVPTFIAGSTFFLMLDTFVYTFSKWGVISSHGFTRFIVLAVYFYLLFKTFRSLRKIHENYVNQDSTRKKLWVSLGVLIILSAVAIALDVFTTDLKSETITPTSAANSIPQKKYNIIFLATDGVEAEIMSAYGYPVSTTPFLDRLKKESLFFENAFSNAGKTTGSVTALLSGMLPVHTKVGFPPQILPKQFAFHHFPSLLKRLGYRGFQSSIRHYADVQDLNLRGGFDIANGRSLTLSSPGPLLEKALRIFNAECNFVERMAERLSSRLLHLSGIQKMINHYLIALGNESRAPTLDEDNITQALNFIDQSNIPFVMHLHLMGTHCCGYEGAPAIFGDSDLHVLEKAGIATSGKILKRLDTIHHADRQFQRVYDHLQARGILDDTILIVSSDHSAKWSSLERVPLMIRFPKAAHRQSSSKNRAFIDVAPTLLDFLGMPIPHWMQGSSFFGADRKADSPILSVPSFLYRRGKFFSEMTAPGPPIFGFASIAGVYGHAWKKMDLQTGKMNSGVIKGHTHPLSDSEIPSDEKAREIFVQTLESEGFILPFRSSEALSR